MISPGQTKTTGNRSDWINGKAITNWARVRGFAAIRRPLRRRDFGSRSKWDSYLMVIDTSALIAILSGEPDAAQLGKLLSQIQNALSQPPHYWRQALS
jgi:hypothetical protein